MKLVSQRYFFALDLDKALDRCSQCCHLCSSLKKALSTLVEQSTSHPPDGFGISFAADVIKRYRQLELIVRETSTSFTASCLLNDELRESIRSGLIQLYLELSPLSGPLSVISVDPAPGFASLCSGKLGESKTQTRIQWQRSASPNLGMSFSVFVLMVVRSLLSP